MGEAFDRVSAAIATVIQRHGDKALAIVLGPLAFALARCRLESVEATQMRTLDTACPVRYESVHLDERSDVRDAVSPPSPITGPPETEPMGVAPEVKPS